MSARVICVFALTASAAVNPLMAQVPDFDPSAIPPLGEPAGQLLVPERPQLVRELDPAAAAAPKRNFEYRLGPAAISTEGANIAGLAAGLTFKRFERHPVSLDGSYMTINTTDNHLDRFEVIARGVVISRLFSGSGGPVKGTGIRLSANGEYWNIRDSKERVAGSLSVSVVPLKSGGGAASPFRLLGTLGWTESEDARGVLNDGLLGKVALQFTRNFVTIGSDYRFRNDVDGDGQWGVTVSHQFGSNKESQLVGRVQSKGTVVLSYGVTFE